MRLLPYNPANCVLHAVLLHRVYLVSRDWQQRDSPHTCITLWLLWVEPPPILSYGAFRPYRLQAFRLRYTARLQCLCRVWWNRTTTSTPVHPHPLRDITFPLAPESETPTTCEESTWSRVCTHPHTPASRLSQGGKICQDSSQPFGYGCRPAPCHP